MIRRNFNFVLFSIIALLVCLGCGGTGASQSSGDTSNALARATFTIEWPDPSRVVPIASKAVQIEVLQSGTVVAKAVGARGSAATTTVSLDRIPAGELTFRATAFPEVAFDTANNGSVSGVPQATGSAPMTTEAGKTAKVRLTMNSTIVRLAIVPSTVKTTVYGIVTPLVATGYDDQDRIVLTDPDRQFVWSSSNPSIVSVGGNNNGVYRGESKGTATITARDKESGKSARATVEVVDKLPVERVELSPNNANLAIGGTLTITARAFDAAGVDLQYGADKFTWSSSDPTKVSVSATGALTGIADGTVTITATEKETGKSGAAQVNVASALQGQELLFYRAPGGYYEKIFVLTESNTLEEIPGFNYDDPQQGAGSHCPSGDGKWIFYYTSASIIAPGAPDRLWRRPLRGGTAEMLYEAPQGRFVREFRPSRDGSKVFAIETITGAVDSYRAILIDSSSPTPTELPIAISNFLSGGLRGCSPDLNRILLYYRAPSGSYETRLLDLQGRTVRAWAQDGPRPVNASFNADGTQMLLHMRERAGNGNDLVSYGQITDLDGAATGTRIDFPNSDKGSVAFHPRKSTIIYLQPGEPPLEIWEIQTDGTRRRIGIPVNYFLPGPQLP